MIKYTNIKTINNWNKIISLVLIATFLCQNIVWACPKISNQYRSLQVNSVFDEDPRNNDTQDEMADEYHIRSGGKNPNNPINEEPQDGIYDKEKILKQPDVPCPVPGGESQIIQALLQVETDIISFLLGTEHGRVWLIYCLQKLFTIDPPFKFDQLFLLTIQVGAEQLFTEYFYQALSTIDPAKAGLIILHLLEICQTSISEQVPEEALDPHITNLKQLLSNIASMWELDPTDTSYITVFFHTKLRERGFLEQLNIYPGKDEYTCYLANEDIGPIIQISGDTPQNVLQIAIGRLSSTHLVFYFPDDLIPYIEYLLSKREFFFPFREEVSAEVQRRKSITKETSPDMDISALGSLYGFVISQEERRRNLRDFIMECTEEYHTKGVEQSSLLPEGIIINHHGIRILLMPDLTRVGKWQMRRTPYRIIGFVEGENLYSLEEKDCKRIETYLSSLPAPEIKHSLILYDYAILADRDVFLKLATSQRGEVYSGHDLALKNEIAGAIASVDGPISIVDVGMGGGELLLKLTKRFTKDKRIRFFGAEPDPKSLRLAKVRLPEYVKVSDVPAEDLSHADFAGDLKGTYKIALVEGVIALGVNEPSKGKEILEELLIMEFDRILITGNTPVNLNYEEIEPILQRHGYKLERTLYPQNLFNYNNPKIMFVISRFKQRPGTDIYPDPRSSSMQLLIREDLVDETGNRLWREREWTTEELLQKNPDSTVTIDENGNMVFDDRFNRKIMEEFELDETMAANVLAAVLDIFRLRKRKYIAKDHKKLNQSVKLYFVDQSQAVSGDCLDNEVVFVNLKVIKKLVKRLPGAKDLLSVYLGIFLSHEILGHEIGIHDESLLTQQDAELFNSQIENLFLLIYDTLIRIFKPESLFIKKLENLIEEFAFVRRIGINKGDKIVSVGGKGDKNTALAIAYLGGNYTGYEIDEMSRIIFSGEFLSIYSYKDYGGSIEYIHGLFSHGSNASRNLEDHSVDSILMLTGVLSDPVPESDAASVLEEALRIVKNGGKIIAGTFGVWPFEYPEQKAVIERVLNSPKWKGKVNLHPIGEGFHPVLGSNYIEYRVEFLDSTNGEKVSPTVVNIPSEGMQALNHKMFRQWIERGKFKAKYRFEGRMDYPSVAITQEGEVISLIYEKNQREWHVAFNYRGVFYVTADGEIKFRDVEDYARVNSFIEAVENAIKNPEETRKRIADFYIEQRKQLETARAWDKERIEKRGCISGLPIPIQDESALAGIDDDKLPMYLFGSIYRTVNGGAFSFIYESVLNEILRRRGYLKILENCIKWADENIVILSKNDLWETCINVLDSAIERAGSIEQRTATTRLKSSYLSNIGKTKEHAKITVDNFLSTIRAKARTCKELDDELVLAIDTDIGNLAVFAQELFTALNELQDALAREGLNNVRIFIGSGKEIEAQLGKYLAEKGDKRNFVISAVVKNKNIAENNLFKDIKDRIQITVVNDGNLENTDSDKLNYIPILSILELSIKKAMGTASSIIREKYTNMPNVEGILEQNGMLIIYLLPTPKPIPINELRERYKYEAQVLTSA